MTHSRKILSLLTFLLVLACAQTAFAKVRVVASIPDLAAIAKEVGGERVVVESLASHAVDPHYVDPRPNLILSLNKADLLIVNGLELESSWLDPLVQQARNAKINPGGPGHFLAAEHAVLIEVPAGKLDRAEGDIHPGGNPHFYMDPVSAISIANALRTRLTKLDPEGSAAYAANAEAFTQELWRVIKQEALRFARLPEAERRVVAYHKSLGYIFKWLGLDEVETVESKPGIPPNPKHVAEVLKTMKERDAHVIVQEDYYPSKTSETVAKLGNGKVVKLAGGTNFEAGERYVDRIKTISRSLYEAVSR